MSQLDKIVDVSISLSSPTVSQAAFSAALAFALTSLFSGDTLEVSQPSDLLDAGFLDSDPAYLAAVDYFSANPSPATLVIGRRSTLRLITIVAVNSTLYTATIADVVYSHTSDGSASTQEIQAGLVSAINVDTSIHHLTATDSSTNAILLTPDATAACPTITLSAHLTITDDGAADTIPNDLGRIARANADWYGIILCNRNDSDAIAVAAWTESASPKKVFVYASANALIYNSSGETSTLAYLWKTAAYMRSAVFYSAVAATRYPDAALFGKILPLNPGSYTAKFKTLAGIPVDNLTDGDITIAAAKNANVYVPVAGDNMVQEGVFALPEYIDVVIFIDWLQAQLKQNVFAMLISQDKVAFTDAGLQGIGSLITKTLADGITVGGLAAVPAPVVTVPKASSYTPEQKAARTASGITFTATLAGAIHFVSIRGNVSV